MTFHTVIGSEVTGQRCIVLFNTFDIFIFNEVIKAFTGCIFYSDKVMDVKHDILVTFYVLLLDLFPSFHNIPTGKTPLRT